MCHNKSLLPGNREPRHPFFLFRCLQESDWGLHKNIYYFYIYSNITPDPNYCRMVNIVTIPYRPSTLLELT